MEWLLILLLPLLLIFLIIGMRYVPEDTVLTVHRFGRYARTLTPGLRFTVPMLDKVAHRVRLVGHQIEVPLAGEAPARAAVYYQILEPERAGDALDRVDALVEQHTSRKLSNLALLDAANDAHQIAATLKDDLNQDLGVLGLRITRCKLCFDAAA